MYVWCLDALIVSGRNVGLERRLDEMLKQQQDMHKQQQDMHEQQQDMQKQQQDMQKQHHQEILGEHAAREQGCRCLCSSI